MSSLTKYASLRLILLSFLVLATMCGGLVAGTTGKIAGRVLDK